MKGKPYLTSDVCKPLNDYGRSKLQAEQLVKAYPKGIIIRIPVLYGHLTQDYNGAIDSLVKKVIEKTPMDMDHYCRRYPANVVDIADMLVAFYTKLNNGKNFKQLYQYCGPKRFTKFEMCCVFARALQTSMDHLHPIDHQSGDAPRPFDVQLDTSELSEFVGFDVKEQQQDFKAYWTKRLSSQ